MQPFENFNNELNIIGSLLIEKMKHPFTSQGLNEIISNKLTNVLYYSEETVGTENALSKHLLELFYQVDDCLSNNITDFDKVIKTYTHLVKIIAYVELSINETTSKEQ